MKHKRKIMTLLTIIGLATCMFLFGCSAEEPKQKLDTLVPAIKIAGIDDLSTTSFPGKAEAGKEVNLSFRVSGPLIDYPVNVGDQITEGDVVARIDPQDFLTTLGTVEGQLSREKASSVKAAADYRRITNIYKEDPGATSKAAIDGARAKRDSSFAVIKSLESAVQNAKDKVSYTSLKAPFSGVVVGTYVENFETVVAKQPIIRLLDPSTIEFVVNIPENLINYAPFVENIVVQFDALPGVQLSAEISEIGKEASTITRTYPVTLAMSQPEKGEILPGMAGVARISARLPEGSMDVGVQLPASAIFTKLDADKSYVWIIDEETTTLKSREVSVGKLTEQGVVIADGLDKGDMVVIKGVHSVQEGQKVRILDVSSEEDQ